MPDYEDQSQDLVWYASSTPSPRAQRRGDSNARPENHENATPAPSRPAGTVLSAASTRRKRIWPAKVTVTGQSKRRCALLDRAKPPRTVAQKWLWISYDFS